MCRLDLARVEKGVRIRGPNRRQEKLACRWVLSLSSWIDGKIEQARSFPRNISKIKQKSTTEITSWMVIMSQ